jgi:hypothetical protein
LACGVVCKAGNYCSANVCTPVKADGEVCANACECQSGACTQFFVDADGDGHGSTVAKSICGTTATANLSKTNDDCCDGDPAAFPGQTAFFTTARLKCGGFDYNCSSANEAQYPAAAGSCATNGNICSALTPPSCPSAGYGWSTAKLPGCGGSGTLVYCPPVLKTCRFGTVCGAPSSSTVVQGCH